MSKRASSTNTNLPKSKQLKREASVAPENLAHLLPAHWKEEVGRWMQQDMPKWDIGGFVVGDDGAEDVTEEDDDGAEDIIYICGLVRRKSIQSLHTTGRNRSRSD